MEYILFNISTYNCKKKIGGIIPGSAGSAGAFKSHRVGLVVVVVSAVQRWGSCRSTKSSKMITDDSNRLDVMRTYTEQNLKRNSGLFLLLYIRTVSNKLFINCIRLPDDRHVSQHLGCNVP